MNDEERKTPGDFWLLDWLGRGVERWMHIVQAGLIGAAGAVLLPLFASGYLDCLSQATCTKAGVYLRDAFISLAMLVVGAVLLVRYFRSRSDSPPE